MNAKKKLPLDRMIRRVEKFIRERHEPYVTEEARARRDPFRVLISCLLSLRTKDDVTAAASRRLFALADTPHDMLRLSEKKIAKTIFPAGFYNTKARNIRAICRQLIRENGSRVPDDIDSLLALPGVGRKTANLVVTMGYGKPGICVDTHVHRISNRWGLVATKTPDKSETALREVLPLRYWICINNLLVTFGQTCCTPISPHCSTCPVETDCPRIGVARHR
jgi:endonuclease-3